MDSKSCLRETKIEACVFKDIGSDDDEETETERVRKRVYNTKVKLGLSIICGITSLESEVLEYDKSL